MANQDFKIVSELIVAIIFAMFIIKESRYKRQNVKVDYADYYHIPLFCF